MNCILRDVCLPTVLEFGHFLKIFLFSGLKHKIMSATKGTPMTKEEVTLLIDLVHGNKIITSKATNATNNRLKDEAWASITSALNASISSCPRTTEQLKLKWENLKKAARKRTAKIRLNRMKTGGGKPDYIPPDDALDRVASILGATCDGYSVPLGGDAEIVIEDKATVELPDKLIGVDIGGGIISLTDDSLAGGGDLSQNEQPLPVHRPQKFFFNTPTGNSVAKQKRKLLDEDVKARTARNLAMAEYFASKKKKIELEAENLLLMNKKLKLQLEKESSK